MMGSKSVEMSGFAGPVIETGGLSGNGFHDSNLILSPHLRRGAGHGGFEGASVSSGVSNLSTSIVGAGIMGLAATMKVLGLPLGIIVLLGMAVITELSLEFLVRTSTAQHVWSYSDLVRQELGNSARVVLDVSVVINNLGICCVYLIVIADVMSGNGTHAGVLLQWNGGVSAGWNSRFVVILVTMLVFLAPLACLKHVDSLHYTSALSVALALVFVVITVILAIIGIAKGSLPAPTWGPNLSNTDGAIAIFSVIPIMATAYVCHFNVHPIYVELKDRSEATMLKICQYSVILCTGIYFFTAVSGCLLFGANTETDLLINFDNPPSFVSPAVADIVRVSYVLHIILVFPVIFYSLRHVTDDFLFPNATKILVEDGRRFYGITFCWLLAIYLLSVIIPNLWMAFTITGATTTMIVGMAYPAYLAIRDQSGCIAGWEKKASYFMMGLAVFVSITGVITSVYYIAHP